MLRLYSGSGSQEIDLQDKILPDEQWAKFKRTAIKLLKTKWDLEAAKLLEDIDFELRAGSNFFGDEFCVLYAVVDLERYLSLGELIHEPETKHVTSQMVSALNELLPLYVRFVAVDLSTDDLPSVVSTPSLTITSATVERAIEDAEHLLRSGQGASSAIDRAHTALHGYLIAVARSINISFDPNERITGIFKRLREMHPKFNYVGPRETEIGLVMKAAATIVDSVNTIRNNASVAHPNETVVPEAEAMFLINIIRSLLHYVEMKLATH